MTFKCMYARKPREQQFLSHPGAVAPVQVAMEAATVAAFRTAPDCLMAILEATPHATLDGIRLVLPGLPR